MKPATTDVAYLTRVILDRQELINGAELLARDIGGKYLKQVLLQGTDLLRMKAMLEHGEWLPWLCKHFKKSADRAQVYMRLASNTASERYLEKAGSISKALALLENGEQQQSTKPKTTPWPAYIQGLNRVSKLTHFMQSHPLAKWPKEGVEQLREDLLPVASELWPEKFSK